VTADKDIRRWFEMLQTTPKTARCRVRYGDKMELSQTFESPDPDAAREGASYMVFPCHNSRS
jgi:hypothetical protein